LVRLCSAVSVGLVLSVAGTGFLAGGSIASASSKPAKAVTTKSLKAFESCLKKHGVKVPSFGAGKPPKGGTPSGTFQPGSGTPGNFKSSGKSQKALKACSALLPAGSQLGGGFGAPPNVSANFAAFRNCMTLHQVVLAKGAYGTTTSSSNVTSTSSSTYTKAYAACSVLLPKVTKKTG